MMKRMFLIILIFVLGITLYPTAGMAKLYSTWDQLELDTCASAWLFKRFVDKEATFKFYPKGEICEEGIPFDTPDARFRRMQAASAFEIIIGEYKLTDSKVIEIGKWIHQLEINYWKGNASEDAEKLKEKVQAVIDSTKDPHDVFVKVFALMDDVYASI